MYATVFPQFGALDVALPPGFVDDSDSARQMPTFIKKLKNGNVLRVWIDFKEKAKSKYPNSPRFTISVYNDSFQRMHDDIEIDKWGDALIYIRGLEEYNTPHPSDKG